MPARHSGKVEKGWGYEIIWATNDLYCGKILVFDKAGKKMSMHFHKEKDETWYVFKGKFKVIWIDTNDASVHEEIISKEEVLCNYDYIAQMYGNSFAKYVKEMGTITAGKEKQFVKIPPDYGKKAMFLQKVICRVR